MQTRATIDRVGSAAPEPASPPVGERSRGNLLARLLSTLRGDKTMVDAYTTTTSSTARAADEKES